MIALAPASISAGSQVVPVVPVQQAAVVKGGEGAADYGVKVFGAMGQQHAQPGSNVIALNKVSGGRRRSSRRRGGKQQKQQQQKQQQQQQQQLQGGEVITEMAVPAVLLAANHLYGKSGSVVESVVPTRRFRSRSTRRSRRARRSLRSRR